MLGESVAVQGACLTVTGFDNNGFTCDVLDETLARTNLGKLPIGADLNLERAMKLGDRIGGHLVTGHVDAVGTIAKIRPAGRDRIVTINCDAAVAAGIVQKGSIAIDGISLTVSAVSDDGFEVNIIPFTWEHTSLRTRSEGDDVNLETDLLGKYVQRYLQTMGDAGGVDMGTLARAGFLAIDT